MYISPNSALVVNWESFSGYLQDRVCPVCIEMTYTVILLRTLVISFFLSVVRRKKIIIDKKYQDDRELLLHQNKGTLWNFKFSMSKTEEKKKKDRDLRAGSIKEYGPKSVWICNLITSI